MRQADAWLPREATKVALISKSEDFTSQTEKAVYSGLKPASTNIIRIMPIMIGLVIKADLREVINRYTDLLKAASIPNKHRFRAHPSQKARKSVA